MNSSISHFPPELLSSIFSYLTKSSQCACLKVCKSWYYTLAQTYYRHVIIGDDDKSSNVIQLIECLEKSPFFAIGHIIQSLHIRRKTEHYRGYKQASTTKEEFKQLIESCPRLQHIEMMTNSVYWRYLYELDLRGLHKLVSYGIKRSDENYFYKVAHQHRSSLKELEIHCSCDQSIREEFDNLVCYLSGFSSLTHLSIKSGSQRDIIYFHRLLEVCSQLETLDYQLDHPFFENHTVPQLSLYPTLRNLSLFLPHLSLEALKYITCRFQNLNKLVLQVNQNDAEQQRRWKQENTGDNVASTLSFFGKEFIQFVKQLDYSHLIFWVNHPSYLDTFVPYYCAHIITCALATACFDVHDGRTELTQMDLKREKEQVKLKFVFIRDFSLLHDMMDFPYLGHLRSYGARLKTLKIVHSTQKGQTTITDIGSVLRLCPTLNSLDIKAITSPRAYLFDDPATLYPPLEGVMIPPDTLQTIATRHPHIKQLSLMNCFTHHKYDLSCLDLTCFEFDISAHQQTRASDKRGAFCVILESRRMHAVDCYLIKSDVFQPISLDELTDEMTVFWFIFNSLNKAELHAKNIQRLKVLC
ncbi:uncharacterized protein B0P05DRAFT_560615 [Gilbertella persicaria]|uniref:uncharacterized protein n=1 Tax=Gilbertella persicaria TaxID=101096 RepID=UPI00221FBB47|nr:uncharacterized protein B0P05DRAFT_560615 [Gilbertella persicaria]KAI8055582.1 hypothetical protein B0P05DRAFT_560615 [Gilbertella persicaria]